MRPVSKLCSVIQQGVISRCILEDHYIIVRPLILTQGQILQQVIIHRVLIQVIGGRVIISTLFHTALSRHLLLMQGLDKLLVLDLNNVLVQHSIVDYV